MFKNSTLHATICFFILIFFTSCYKGFLDQVPDDRLTVDEIFESRVTAEKFLLNVYSSVPNENNQRFAPSENAGMWTGGSDEADYVWSFVRTNDINIGNWDANAEFVRAYWRNYYQAIRSATFFMDNVYRVVDLPQQLKDQYWAEAKALRALYYFYLLKIYGPVILLNDEIIAPDAPATEVERGRNSIDECIDYITAELNEAAQKLPISHNANNWGRLTKGAALAIRAQALLYGASPLFNGNQDYTDWVNSDGKQLFSMEYSAEKWQRAAGAYREFIDEFVPGVYDLFQMNDANGEFDPYLSCRGVYLIDWNKESIFARATNSLLIRQHEMTPYHSGYASEARGNGGLAATQNLVDAFFTENGRSIDDPKSNYVKAGFSDTQTKYTRPGTYNQWVNREPRFYVNITFSGSVWLNKNSGEIVTELFYNGNSGRSFSGHDYPTTGYIVRKGMGLGTWDVNDRSLVLIRLAEIYLSYIEALNEVEPEHPDILKYLNLIRKRAGIPEYGSNELEAPASQAAMREAIRRERRIELAFENHRYFDVRRWKIAPETENGPIYGLDMNANVPDFFHVKVIENRVFNPRHYFFPLPQNEVSNNKLLVQNPGW